MILITPAIICHSGTSLSFCNISSNGLPPGLLPLPISPLPGLLSSGLLGSCVGKSGSVCGYDGLLGELGSTNLSLGLTLNSCQAVSIVPSANIKLASWLSFIFALILYVSPAFKSLYDTTFSSLSTISYSTPLICPYVNLSVGGLILSFQSTAICALTIS